MYPSQQNIIIFLFLWDTIENNTDIHSIYTKFAITEYVLIYSLVNLSNIYKSTLDMLDMPVNPNTSVPTGNYTVY